MTISDLLRAGSFCVSLQLNFTGTAAGCNRRDVFPFGVPPSGGIADFPKNRLKAGLQTCRAKNFVFFVFFVVILFQ